MKKSIIKMTVMAFIIGLPAFKCIAAIPPKVVMMPVTFVNNGICILGRFTVQE